MLLGPAAMVAAKFRREPKGGSASHPLICHMLDVAAVAEALWDECLPRRVRDHLADSWALDASSARAWIAFLAGIHDLGKATPVFQAKGSPDSRSTPPWLRNTPLAFGPLGVYDPGHGPVTARHLPAFLTDKFDVPDQVAIRLSVITGGHHGMFPTATQRSKAYGTRLGEPQQGQPNQWAKVREDLTTSLAEIVVLRGSPKLPSNADSMLLAGIISVVDWIGSIDDDAFFPYAPDGPDDLPAYLSARRGRAREALRVLHWNAWSQSSSPSRFQDLFPFPPRHLQAATEQLAPEVCAPGLTILEAPMGEGKTEAAFYLADYWNALGFRGSYIAMPTQATSNQLYQRFEQFLRGRFGPGERVNLQLLHGHAALNAEIKLLEAGETHPMPSGIDTGSAEEDATVGAGEWFTYRKRGLLAPFGVGTVDQALLAVLQVKHGFVRLFGLAGKTVIVDEVHAYDTYMTTLLERLLEWLAALGSPVVLLSATLPSHRRKGLLNAYLKGTNRPAAELSSEGYPRITWTTKSGEVGAARVEAAPETRRTLGFRWLPSGVDLPAHLLSLLDDGGCAAVVCNTVNRAQEIYTTLQDACAALPPEGRPDLDLFHARFLFKDREDREERCLRHFGKPNAPGGITPGRPRRSILVATQVIEQSLDLDFDIMVSEVAPVDLLLQRSGRLHRHRRADRADGDPVLRVLGPDLDADGLPAFERATTYVYDGHILLRTWLALRDREAIAIPEEVEGLIEDVYRESEEPPAGARGPLVARWHRTLDAMKAKRQHESAEAQQRRIPTPWSQARLEDHTRDPREEDAGDLHPALQALTRLAQPTAEVVLLPENSPLLAAANSAPSLLTTRELLRHSVSISAPDVVRELLAQPVPTLWKRSGLLRRLRVLTLDDTGSRLAGSTMLRYTTDLGLEIIRS